MPNFAAVFKVKVPEVPELVEGPKGRLENSKI